MPDSSSRPRRPAFALLHLLVFLSGAAALVYEVVWVRALSLVFGGSHLAVTTVLSVFMAGLALGSALLGRRADRSASPLRLYGCLEIGIGGSGLAFALLMRVYPAAYDPLARWAETDAVWLTTLRVLFTVAALIVPTTLMGGTLPVLSRIAAAEPDRLARRLASFYAVNTLGAVAGTLAAGLVLLRAVGVSSTLWTAVTLNGAIGGAAFVLARRDARAPGRPIPAPLDAGGPPERGRLLPALVLGGIGLSGFCALGYEVLWTRVLTMVAGTSVYSFAIMLAAFLAGIAGGSQAMAVFLRRRGEPRPGAGSSAVRAFGIVQVAIGAAALGTTHALRSLPTYAPRLQDWLSVAGSEFAARQAATFLLAFGCMAVPAFFLGLAVPLAGAIHVRRHGRVGGAVGTVLAFNTVGAILGAAASGFALLFLFGIERSLELLVALNVGLGATVLAGTLRGRHGRFGAGLASAATVVLLAGLALAPEWVRTWDRHLLAVYRNNQRAAFATPDRTRDALENTEVLYYHEGINDTISVIRPRRGAQALLVNGRIEASTQPEDVQCQRTLGHLPMLVHPKPRRVFVLGLGTGMTLGATSLHPEVESLTLAEIEPGVLPAARTFGDYNHRVLDDPKLRVVHDDGRNFLRTTHERFDVITADPIHPWSSRAAYLYTVEYFESAAEHLAPGGVMCQWLPIYELSVEDVRSVVATFAASFRHTALWLTYYDAEILASNEPLALDEAALGRRLSTSPAIAADLAAVDMGSPRALLSYFLLGDAGVRAFADGAPLNTDDNLGLEFSAPRSQGIAERTTDNLAALVARRESPLAYTLPLADRDAEIERRAYWARISAAARLGDRAHVLALADRFADPELAAALDALRADHPDYAPARFLEARRELALGRTPRALAARRFAVRDERGRAATLEIAAVAMRVGNGRAVLVLADNERREVYGQRYVDAPEDELDGRLFVLADEVLDALGAAYRRGPGAVDTRTAPPPGRAEVALRLKAEIATLWPPGPHP